MKNYKKIIWILILTFIIGLTNNISAETDEDFASNKSHYEKLCSTAYTKNKSVCDQYSDWLKREINSSQDELAKLKEQVANNELEIDRQIELLDSLSLEISTLETEIADMNIMIKDKENNIIVLGEQIEDRIKNIEEKEAQVLVYISSMQESMRVNDYINFVMGASSFSEMVRRVEGINSIKSYNEEIIEELNKEKEILEEEKETLLSVKKQLELDQELLKSKKAVAQEKQVVAKELVDSMAKKNQQLVETMETFEEKVVISQDVINNFGDVSTEGPNAGGGFSPSGGFGPVLGSGYRISATPWTYDNGAAHFGLDFATPVGTSILAPGNGLVTLTKGGCATYGSYGCNGGFGNYVSMIINVDGTIYGVLMAHQKLGSFTVSPGTVITMGTKIGEVGSSGNSTGPHLHLEIYYLGNDSIPDAYNRWSGSSTFDTGSASSGAWNKLCHNNGYNYPCRIDPRQFY